MTESTLTTSEALGRYADFFNGLSRRDLSAIDTLYSSEAHYVDPFTDVRGRESIRQLFDHRFEQRADLQLKVFDTAQSVAAAYLHWHMTFKPRSRWLGKHRCHLDGMSQIKFDAAGLITYQRDYCDAGTLYERLPLAGGMVRMVKNLI